ncbi:MAG: SGNH/GDSL hydrolase family protein [Lachnospiraceae bacterium]|nr:SGNH/GDSL hydrolase family protein [Lachnospiraceae bacterium]
METIKESLSKTGDTETVETVAKPAENGEEETPEERGSNSQGSWFYQAGDVVGFIGDSITHVEYSAINYVEFLYNYYLSRFPHQEVEFRNLGVSSYKASDILDIYDRDPAFRGINKAVIMLGMNEALKEVPTETYISNMEKLVERLKEDGLKGEDILVLSPTPYDQTCSANFDANGNPYRMTDNALTDFTEQLALKTQEWGVRYVDLHTPMVELTLEIQKNGPDNTLTVWDCVHPNAMGQMAMAYYILKAQGANATVGEMFIGADAVEAFLEADDRVTGIHGTISDFYRGEKGLCWNWKPETLPMAMTFEFQEFYQLFDLVSELNQESLQVEGLEEGTSYTLAMDGEELGSFTGGELAQGINLAVLETNPQQVAMQLVEFQNQSWHVNSAEYRKVVRFATMAEPTHTMDEMLEAYEEWKDEDIRLRNEMYDIVQGTIQKESHITITREGYSAEELELDAELALQKAKEMEAQKTREEISTKDQEQPIKENVQKSPVVGILLAIAGGALVLLAVIFIFIRRKDFADREDN